MRCALLSILIYLAPICCHAQQVTEGGMRFTRRNNDIIRMSNGATAGLQLGGSAAVDAGGINVGSASSDIALELNPVTRAVAEEQEGGIRGDLLVAGSPSIWSKTLQLQRTTPVSTRELISRRISVGSIDSPENSELRNLIQRQPNWIEIITKENLKDPSQPFTTVQFTEDYDQLIALLDRRDLATGKNAHKGLAIYSMTGDSSTTYRPNLKEKLNLMAWGQLDPSTQGKEGEVNPVFKNHAPISSDKDAINISNLQNAGTSKVLTRFTILGFNKNPDPMAGKSSQMSAFAGTTKTVGSLRVTRSSDGTVPTLEKIARQYGVPIEQLLQVNNISDASLDIEGILLTIPADFSTVDIIKIPNGTTTPAELAKTYGLSVSWLLELNGLKHPDQPLKEGTSFYVPGLKSPNTIALKESTTPSQLAKLYGVSTSLLLSLNNLTDPEQQLNAGDPFILPSPRIQATVILDQEETPSEIAQRYGVSTAALLELNGLNNSNQKLGTGTRISIPSRPLLPDPKPLSAELETADYGAYTNYSVTYHLEGSLVPLFAPTLFNTLR